MAYTTVEQVVAGFRELDDDEKAKCNALIEEADIMIDARNSKANDDVKRVVECRMVRRALGSGDDGVNVPIGASQGSMSAMGYSQSWTIGSGSSGELYLSKTEKDLLGVGNRIGSHSPIEDMVAE